LKRREMMKLVDLPYPCSNGDMLFYSIRSSYFGTNCVHKSTFSGGTSGIDPEAQGMHGLFEKQGNDEVS